VTTDLNIVIPMAGRGTRFAEAGFDDPKPLIDVRGRPMYTWATESLPLDMAKRLVFVCLAEHLEDNRLREDIQKRYAAHNPTIIELDEVTEGQACTVLKAKEFIDNESPLIIYNSDTFIKTDLKSRLPKLRHEVDGVFSVFEAPGDKWSFAKVGSDGFVKHTAEKVRISKHASTGLYHFQRGKDFVAAAEGAIADDERSGKEFYVAPLYNRLIENGARIVVDEAKEVWVMGTPEDLKHFEAECPHKEP